MRFIKSLTTCPAPFDPEFGKEIAAIYTGADPAFLDLVAGVAGSSPYLAGLLRSEVDWARAIPDADPQVMLAEVLADLPEDTKSLGPALRQAKRRVALLTALCDIGGVWPLEQVTGVLSQLADRAVQTGLAALQRQALDRGKLPGCTQDDLATGAGMVVLGMGKLGAGELNYSSDIDLIVLFDETRFEVEDYAQVRQGFVRVTQDLVKLLSAQTEHGYVFRTDLRLRPDAATTPVCIAMEPAERYYESLGRTWERAMMIKARPIAGDFAAGAAFLDRLTPFVWRRHLDFTAVQDAQDMVLKIRAHKGLGRRTEVAGHDMKLGRGGIREIEFFAQTHQLIFGGRDPQQRCNGTVPALAALAEAERIAPDRAEALIAHYRAHRTLEHRIQMLDDAQTHIIPTNPEKRHRLACLAGFDDVARFETAVAQRLKKVQKLTEIKRIGDDPVPETPDISSPFMDTFSTFAAKWATRPALRSARSRDIFDRLRPALTERLLAAGDPDRALRQFDAFVTALPAGVQLFSLFESNPHLLALMIDICGVSPDLAAYLGRNSAVLDAVLDRDFYAPFPDVAELCDDLDARMAGVTDYEAQLDMVRRWQKEMHFRAGVHLLRGIGDIPEIARAFSHIADASVSGLLPYVIAEHARRFGQPPGRGAVVLGMGKLGGADMTARSDLDLIVIYDPAGAVASEGPKSLAVTAYFNRLTQALIAGLTAPTSEGRLYEVDMRLRPSGQKGPVATTLNAFAAYQRDEAWTWEHLALTRARVIAGPDDLARDVEAAIDAAMDKPRDVARTVQDAADMRARLAAAHRDDTRAPWEVKQGPGRLLDIELAVQTGLVLNRIKGLRTVRAALPALTACGWISPEDAETLGGAHQLLGAVQHVARLIGTGFNPDNLSPAQQKVLKKTTDIADADTLQQAMATAAQDAARVIDRVLQEPKA